MEQQRCCLWNMKGPFSEGCGEPVILRTCQGMLNRSCLQSTGLGWVSLSQSFMEPGWGAGGLGWVGGVLMSYSVCRSWWGGGNAKTPQTHVAHHFQLYHLWHANDDHVNWGHANQAHANQAHANWGPANQVSSSQLKFHLGKGLDHWAMALWCLLRAFHG